MKEVFMIKGAKKIVDICTKPKAGENILIVTDYNKFNIATVLVLALNERGFQPVVNIMFPNRLDGEEPPQLIAEAMLKADLIIMPVSQSISHSTAVHNALDNGARVLALSACTEELLYEGGIEADFEKQKEECLRFAKYFSDADQVTISSPGGTNFTANIKNRKGNAHYCIVEEPGQYSAIPNIEANTSPVEGESEGKIVIDGSLPNFNIGIIETPIEMPIKDGLITDIKGGKEAAIIKDILDELNSPMAFNVGQIAIGLNPKVKRFNGIMLNDHGVYGSAHIGIGTSHNLGGEVKAPLHFDGMIANPTISFDGKTVIKGGKIVG